MGYDDTIEGAIVDETSDAFGDWFANAYKYVDDDGVIRDSRDPDNGDEECAVETNSDDSKRIGDEMAGTLSNVYGDQEKEEADEHYGNEDHFIAGEVTKTMDTVYSK